MAIPPALAGLFLNLAMCTRRQDTSKILLMAETRAGREASEGAKTQGKRGQNPEKQGRAVR
jgi:hypothetical protein